VDGDQLSVQKPAKLHRVADDFYAFHCPGCGNAHAVTVNGKINSSGASWTWNGSMDKPTFTPSINCNPGSPENHCHSWVRNGMIEFLGDCHHSLAGQTVEIPSWED